jgi:drug/metabolite transporter (DMT)-like permease
VAAALLAVYVLWGSTYLGIRVAIETMPPMLMASLRFLLAGGLLYVFARRGSAAAGDRPQLRHWRAALIAGGLMLAGGNGGVTWAEQHLPSGLVALIVALVPLWMTVIAHFTGSERMTLPVMAGVVIGLAGVAILAGPALGAPGDLLALMVVIAGSIMWAAGSLYSRQAAMPRPPLMGIAMQMLAGSAVLFVVAAFGGELGRVHLNQVSPASAAGLAYLVVFGSLVAFTAYAWLLRNAKTSLVGTYAFVNPAIAVFLGWLLLGERVTSSTLIGGVVILAAVGLIVMSRSLRVPWRRRVAAGIQPEAEVA